MQAAPEDVTHEWVPGQLVHIPPGTVHRFGVQEDSLLLEVSTSHLTDAIRLNDDYRRE